MGKQQVNPTKMESLKGKAASEDLDMAESQGQGRSYGGTSYDYYDYDGGASQASSFSKRQLFSGLSSSLSKKASPAKLKTSASNSLGSYSYGSYGGGGHHGGHYDKCDNGISIGLLLTALLGIGVMFFTLFTKITMISRRRRSLREQLEDSDPYRMVLNQFSDIVYEGNAEGLAKTNIFHYSFLLTIQSNFFVTLYKCK